MKTRPFVWPAILCPAAIIFISLSCQKSVNRTPTASTDSTAVFSATIGGTSWTADSVLAVLVSSDDHHGKAMTITGFSADTQLVVLLQDTSVTTATDSSIGVHSYVVGYPWPGAAFSFLADKIEIRHDSVWQHQGIAESGQATVTASNATGKKVTGTFSFTAAVITVDTTFGQPFTVDTVAVTNGVFKNIPYSWVRRH